jgi:protein-S-isoprenylcysteine O-methyltransferase Ste14
MSAERIPDPGVRFPPPLLFVSGFLAGWLIHRALPLAIAGGRRPVTSAIGWLLIAAGLTIIAAGLLTFVRHRTAILPHHAASRLVTTGPYRFTRNPMYVGITSLYLGLALLTAMAWPLLLLPAVLFALWRFVISREERYLASEFGSDYEEYRRKVGRWV